MTPNPTYVSLDDPAMDALITMIENHFRHLPVVDSNGSVVGLLDISKCLSEAIARLEKLADNDRESVNNAGEAVKRVIKQTPGDDSQTAVLQALLSKLMSNATGGQTIPTLRSILHGKPSTIVTPSSSIRNAGIVMGENRKAILVVEEGRLQGIFGFRDMVTRAVAKGLPLDLTPISKVMTAHPEYVSPDMTVLEALQSMADNNFTTLPVCENDGTVVGLVDVLDLIYGCGAGSEEGWRSIFTSAMDAGDDVSELGSVPDKTKIVSLPSNYVENKPILNTVAESVEERTVAKLRPPKSMFVAPDDAILRCCQAMTSKRKTSALIVSSDGQLEGIFTDKDVTIRVIAKGIDPMVTPVAKVMTTGVSCVAASDPALDALIRMVENKFRHLPVIDHDGAVMGTLDISKCLSSIIHKLERLENATTSFDAAEELIKQVGVSGTQERMYEVLKLLLKNKATPTLRTLLHGKPSSIIPLSATIRDAAIVMAASGHAALVVDKERLVGIFGWRDARLAVGNEIPLDETLVADVMTSEPEFVSPELSALEALHILSDSQILSLPVCEADGTVLGVVDVMDIIGGCGSSKDWKPIFSKALEITDNTVADESVICRSPPKKLKEKTVAQLRPSKAHLSLPNESVLSVAQYLQRKRGSASLVVSLEGALAGIVTDTDFVSIL
jgi:signal-transduction protein with cAMP-binding, CBS, and nucleotidyltransferase domain